MTTVMRRLGSLATVLTVLVALVLSLEGCGKKAEEFAEETPSDSAQSMTPDTTSTVSEPIAANDRAMESLSQANIAYNVPRTMNVRETRQIQLLLSLTRSVADLERSLRHRGEHQGATIRVSERMAATLSGANFSITALTPEEQAITSVSETEWRWEVQATRPGHHQLHLTMSALLLVNGTPTGKAIKTFDRVIDVQVTWGQLLSGFVTGNWQWLWAVVVVPVAGWLWSRRKRSRKGRASKAG